MDWKKYLIVLVLTALVFFTAITLATGVSDRRLAEIRSIESKIALDILSSETQFQLLEESSCKDAEDGALSEELNALAAKLSQTEARLGEDNSEVQDLKRYYTLLQIKDYILMKKVAKKCNIEPVFVLYFYSNQGECTDCKHQGYVLDYLRNEYPRTRIYAFDYHLNLPALETLIAINKIGDELPAIVYEGKKYIGFQSKEVLEELIPELANMRAATSTQEE